MKTADVSTERISETTSELPPPEAASPSFFRRRAIRAVTRLPEILDTLTRHWLTILICIGLGSVACWGKVLMDPLIYSGSATLMVNPSNAYLLGQERQQAWRTKDDIQRFLFAQMSLLRNDSVSRKFVKLAGLADAAEGPSGDGYPARLRRKLKDAKQRVMEVLALDKYGAREPTEEERIQKAIERFGKRSVVTVDPSSSTIELTILGPDRSQIFTELNSWIQAYRDHVEEMDLESGEAFFDDRLGFYAKLENEAKQKLDEFRAEHPDVTDSRLESLNRKVAALEFGRDLLIRSLSEHLLSITSNAPGMNPAGGGLGPGATAPVDPEYAASVAQKAAWEKELFERQAEGYTEESNVVRGLRQKIAMVEEKLRPRVSSGTEGSGDTRSPWARQLEEEREAFRKSAKEQLDELQVELQALILEKSRLKEQLEEMARIEQKYESLVEKRESFDTLSHETKDLLESWKTVNIQVSSRPMVSTEPYNQPPLLIILIGAAGGFGAGVLVAFLYEVLCNKVRFKYDLVEGYGLPVMAVVPER